MTPVRLEPAASLSPVKHSITELLRSLSFLVKQSSCGGRESWLQYFNWDVAFCVLCLFRMVPLVAYNWSALLIVAFPGHTHFLFCGGAPHIVLALTYLSKNLLGNITTSDNFIG